MGDIERIINHIYYYVPHNEGKAYLVVCDREIHGVAYSDLTTDAYDRKFIRLILYMFQENYIFAMM